MLGLNRLYTLTSVAQSPTTHCVFPMICSKHSASLQVCKLVPALPFSVSVLKTQTLLKFYLVFKTC